jgi:hypothetical protein
MNPINILKIKIFLESCENIEYKINLDGSVDFLGEYTTLDIKDIYRFFPETDLNNFELPFKINTTRAFILANGFEESVVLKSCRNFPEYSDSYLFITHHIIVKSLDGLRTINSNLRINFVDHEKYRNKEDLKRIYPELKIAGFIQFVDEKCEHKRFIE